MAKLSPLNESTPLLRRIEYHQQQIRSLLEEVTYSLHKIIKLLEKEK